jgi:protein TonB
MRILKRSAWIAGVLAVTCAGAAEIRVSTADALQNATEKPSPEYTAIARQLKVVGKVEVEAVIAPDGTVESVKALTGNPLLSASAVNAVKRWKFKPFTENGEPARAVAVLSFDFTP